MEIAKMIDYTLLKSNATDNDIKKLCTEAKEYNFASVCINPVYVNFAKNLLERSDIKVCTVIGFPLGANTIKTKTYEAKDAIKNGADEIDMVLNIGRLKSGDFDYIEKEIKAVVKESKALKNVIIKVILENCYLTDEEKIRACEIVVHSGADFVKTSTGFGIGGATIDDVRLMRKTVGDNFGVKASGGVRTSEDARLMIKAGANRIGTSSGIQIVKGW
ncbi:deoxyribose-phosphate aldolase [Aceticella autotrophica]|uniref:Deoxyribose-phosphate aldolase n=1 Tax=Aceticella autotrophica TaxID=2755338 RepID=A0A975AXV4_9THEO|nr:deoxyribose-phosphate aldolase [Aceticella autotrophica]QSZ28408.1 deoxyribose-phosphate aldolase [Aceticella autotrophica]